MKVPNSTGQECHIFLGFPPPITLCVRMGSWRLSWIILLSILPQLCKLLDTFLRVCLARRTRDEHDIDIPSWVAWYVSRWLVGQTQSDRFSPRSRTRATFRCCLGSVVFCHCLASKFRRMFTKSKMDKITPSHTVPCASHRQSCLATWNHNQYICPLAWLARDYRDSFEVRRVTSPCDICNDPVMVEIVPRPQSRYIMPMKTPTIWQKAQTDWSI